MILCLLLASAGLAAATLPGPVAIINGAAPSPTAALHRRQSEGQVSCILSVSASIYPPVPTNTQELRDDVTTNGCRVTVPASLSDDWNTEFSNAVTFLSTVESAVAHATDCGVESAFLSLSSIGECTGTTTVLYVSGTATQTSDLFDPLVVPTSTMFFNSESAATRLDGVLAAAAALAIGVGMLLA
jgi:hypothetical protein